MYNSTIKRPNNSKSKYENKDRPVYQSLKTFIDFFKSVPIKNNVGSIKGKLKYGHVKDPWNSTDTSMNPRSIFNDDLTIKNASSQKLGQNQRSSSYKSLKSLPYPKVEKKNFPCFDLDKKPGTNLPTLPNCFKHFRISSQNDLRSESPQIQETSYRTKKLRSNTKFEPNPEHRPQKKSPKKPQNPSFKYKEYFTISGWDTEN